MTYFWGTSKGRVNDHFIPAGKPAPPRPRIPEALTSSTTCSGVMLVTTFFRALYPPLATIIVHLFRIDDAHIAQQHQFRRALFVALKVVGAVGQRFIVRGLAGPVVGQDLFDLVFGKVAVHHFVDLHGRGHFADAQAGCGLQGKEAVRRGFSDFNSQLLLHGVEHVLGAADMAGGRLAEADDIFPLGLPGIHGVETHDPKDVAAGDLEFAGNTLLHFRRQVAHGLLDFLQDRHEIAGLILIFLHNTYLLWPSPQG